MPAFGYRGAGLEQIDRNPKRDKRGSGRPLPTANGMLLDVAYRVEGDLRGDHLFGKMGGV